MSHPKSKTDKTKLAVYIIEDVECAQFRYRVKNVIEALEKSESWKATYLPKTKIEKIDFDKTSLLIIERQTGKDNTIKSLIKKAHTNRIKVLFDIDDLVFNYKDIPLIVKTTRDKNFLYWLGYIFCIRRIMKHSDGFLTTNDFLAKKLKCSFEKPVAVIPNSLNFEQIAISEKTLKQKSKIKNKTFTLGYFSGSPTHTKDFRLIEPEIIKFLNTYPDSKLKIVGFMDFSASAKKLLEEGRIIFEKPVGYLKLQEKIASVNVNLAPLVINDFTNSKSELKFFEAAIVEVPTIASPSFVFKKAIKDGETGLIAKPGEWYKKLKYLYENPEKSKIIAKNARNYCLKKYYGKNFLNEVEEAYNLV
ncbi:glycosyltransferase [Candidatus Saccharibacteria bacterium]|nr:glycosyltransferase [Candidatus Saccharibacteria bacterium]